MKYEHKIVNITNVDEITKELDRLSEDGWELIAVVEERHYFKRPKEEIL